MVNILRIGRGDDCEIKFNDKSVSRRHAELFISRSGKMYLLDCNSTYGTFLFSEGKKNKISQSEISIDEDIYFGQLKISSQEFNLMIRNSLSFVQTGFQTIRRVSRRLVGH
ncbi:MAG: FHA domain-containing protein [Flavobacteriaceae bacterium]|nr:FHA domain-containing protein [Flavobacteriaceae bacterium]